MSVVYVTDSRVAAGWLETILIRLHKGIVTSLRYSDFCFLHFVDLQGAVSLEPK